MSLAAGRRLGPYQIESVIGSGGMGEVYLARDTRLGRSVAVKILPAHLSEINSRRRFDHEARVVSNLNHPNICAIHDVGHDDDIDYLVMEYLQGETLEARLRRGPLPLEQALRIAIDIAGAMHVAHMAGVVHRDLKPGNIMLTGSGTKLLDFGLAKIVASRAGDTTVTSALTSDSPLTADQTIVGTLAYMAPEQLEGRAVDMRADIFALGAVLYEMISGRRAFAGESRAAIIAAILTGDPPPASTVNPSVPVGLDRVITRCLARSPEERWQNAHDLRLTLEWIREGGDAHAVLTKGGNTRERWIWAALVTALALAVVALWSVSARRHAPEQPALLLSVTPPKEDASIRDAVISPDGRWLAFTAALPRQLHSIWIRRLDATEAQLLPGTEGVGTLFWSPDNRFVAYFIGTRLMKIEIPDGTPQAICDALHGERGTWGTDGTILFGNNGPEGILRVSASGGTPSPATRPTGTAPVGGDMHPYFLPDSHHFLFDRDAGRDSLSGIFVGALDSDETVRILPDQSSVAYAPPGYLLFVRARNLVAQPFDAATLRLGGQPHTIAANIADIDFTRYIFSVSANGMLAFRSVDRNSRLAWIDRTGRLLQKVGEPADYVSVDLSPDDTRAAVERIDPESGDHDVWIVDLARETSSRLTFDSGEEMYPIWSPDGTRVAYALRKNGQVARAGEVSQRRRPDRYAGRVRFVFQVALELVARLSGLRMRRAGSLSGYVGETPGRSHEGGAVRENTPLGGRRADIPRRSLARRDGGRRVARSKLSHPRREVAGGARWRRASQMETRRQGVVLRYVGGSVVGRGLRRRSVSRRHTASAFQPSRHQSLQEPLSPRGGARRSEVSRQHRRNPTHDRNDRD
jgi:Tol biopolymer transport system component